MSIWKTSDNKPLNPTGSFDTGGGNLEPIPEGTSVLAAPVEACWKNYEGEDYISLQWQVLAPADYKNRRVFHKIKTGEPDQAKADRAVRMLTAIDANAGGHLLAAGTDPTDESLTKHLVGKPMMLKLGVWEINDKTGNWVIAVSPKQGGTPATQPSPAAPIQEPDVPF